MGAGLPEAEVRDLVVDPTSPARLFAATEAGLYRSADSGGTWSRVGPELEDVEAVAVDRAKGTVFAGTFDGAFRSADGGATWAPMGEGLANTDVRALAVGGNPPRLWAGLAGGSVASIELP